MWSAILAALVGWGLAGFEAYGFFVGGAIGAGAGWAMRTAIRGEVAAATAALRDEIEALRHRYDDAGDIPTSIAPEPPRPAPYFVPDPAAVPAPTPPPPQVWDAPPSDPGEPGIVETALAAARGWLLGGNTIVRVGLVILFVGLSFLARYAASAGLFPIEVRLTAVAAVGIALLLVGFRTRTRRPGFGLALQGAGIAAIYLTLFAAARLYDTVAVAPAFALMIAICALGCALALLQRSQALALTAFAGGFAVPLLLSDGGGAAAGLFAYYTILNLAILFVATRRAWRLLDLLGFFATFGVMGLWMATGYRPADFAVTQAFLAASVLIYLATAVLYTRGTPGRFGHVVDTSLLFGPAVAGFALEVALVHDQPFGSAFAAVGFAALYLGVAGFAMRRRFEGLRVMNETMLAIGVGFVTLAVPLALDARWTSAAWALQGAGAVWVGMRQARWLPRAFGLLLQGAAALIYLATLGGNVAAVPLANPAFVGAMLIALAVLATSWWLRGPLPHGGSRLATRYAGVEAMLGGPVFLFGFGFWWLGWAVEAARLLPPVESGGLPVPVLAAGIRVLLAMLAYVASAVAAQAIGRRLRWRIATAPAHATLAALGLGFVAAVAAGSRVLYLPDIAIWAVTIALHLRALHVADADGAGSGPAWQALRFGHAGGVWLATALLADALLLGIERGRLWRAAWAEASVLAGLVLVLVILTLWAGRALRDGPRASRWPLDLHAADYAWVAAVPIAALLALAAIVVALFSSGSAAPLPYLPLANPADLTIALALAALEAWRRTVVGVSTAGKGAGALAGRRARAGLAVLGFVAVNTAWLRAVHHLGGVAWDMGPLFASVVAQTGFAILWTLVALALMVVAHRRGRRTLWLAGAGLLGLTVVKLLLVDMTHVGGAARIVAFIAVGLLMLVVGYLAPLPPRMEPPPEVPPPSEVPA